MGLFLLKTEISLFIGFVWSFMLLGAGVGALRENVPSLRPEHLIDMQMNCFRSLWTITEDNRWQGMQLGQFLHRLFVRNWNNFFLVKEKKDQIVPLSDPHPCYGITFLTSLDTGWHDTLSPAHNNFSFFFFFLIAIMLSLSCLNLNQSTLSINHCNYKIVINIWRINGSCGY